MEGNLTRWIEFKVHIPHNPEIPFLGMYFRETLTSEGKETGTRVFPVLLFVKVKN